MLYQNMYCGVDVILFRVQFNCNSDPALMNRSFGPSISAKASERRSGMARVRCEADGADGN